MQTPDLEQDFKKYRRRGLPCCLLFVLIVAVFVGYLVFSYYTARNRGIARTEILYNALRSSDESVVKPMVTGYALDKLDELEAEFGKVLSYEMVEFSAKPADMWMVRLRVKRERARTVEEVSNGSSGNVIRFVHGAPDTQ